MPPAVRSMLLNHTMLRIYYRLSAGCLFVQGTPEQFRVPLCNPPPKLMKGVTEFAITLIATWYQDILSTIR